MKATWRAHTTTGSMSAADRDALPESVFAFPKQRKEPLIDATHVRNAIARFDQVADVADDERAQAVASIHAAARHYDVAISATSWRKLMR